MSAAEDDTELRDLLIQNLENSGVLNKLKAEMRAAVFLAMEEQDRLENKAPLVNENLKKCLNTGDGRLVASLIVDFLQVFNLDFSLAVFQPEINSLSGLDGRDLVCRELGLSESHLNKKSPVLLELVRRGRHKDKPLLTEEPSQKQIAHAREKFDIYDKDRSGSVGQEDLRSVFSDLFPGLNKNMVDRFLSDELRAADRSSSSSVVDSHLFLDLYRRLFAQCRTVVVQDCDVIADDVRSPPVAQNSTVSLGDVDNKRTSSSGPRRDRVDLDLEGKDDPEEGDSFFDDPLPKPQKTYGRKVEASGARGSPAGSQSESQRPGPGPAESRSEARRPGPGPGGGSSSSELSHSRNGVSNSREKGFKAPSDRTGSLHLDDDVEYDDDFNSHRSDLSKSELSIGEEIEEVSIEGPDHSDKFDETTQDLSVSQLSQSHGADYMEDVA